MKSKRFPYVAHGGRVLPKNSPLLGAELILTPHGPFVGAKTVSVTLEHNFTGPETANTTVLEVTAYRWEPIEQFTGTMLD
jgi:hypothetical protein